MRRGQSVAVERLAGSGSTAVFLRAAERCKSYLGRSGSAGSGVGRRRCGRLLLNRRRRRYGWVRSCLLYVREGRRLLKCGHGNRETNEQPGSRHRITYGNAHTWRPTVRATDLPCERHRVSGFRMNRRPPLYRLAPTRAMTCSATDVNTLACAASCSLAEAVSPAWAAVCWVAELMLETTRLISWRPRS